MAMLALVTLGIAFLAASLPGRVECNCDFEVDTCGYMTYPPGWNRQYGRDGSGGYGYYLYVDAFSTTSNAIMDISDPQISANGNPYCVIFMYYMNDPDVGTLRITGMQPGTSNEVKYWEVSGPQGDRWTTGQVPISSFPIRFVGTSGTGNRNGIKLDEIVIKRIYCTQTPPWSDPPQSAVNPPVLPPTVVQQVANHGDFFCDFETGSDPYCGFRNYTDSTVRRSFLRSNRGTPSQGTGPDYDHTTNSGFFLYAEATDNENQKAVLLSKPFSRGPHCLTFWYCMYGQHMGELQVLDWRTKTTLLTQRGNQGLFWHQITQTLEAEVVQIAFQATIGNAYQSDIALDDISIRPGSCYSTTPYPDTEPSAEPEAEPETEPEPEPETYPKPEPPAPYKPHNTKVIVSQNTFETSEEIGEIVDTVDPQIAKNWIQDVVYDKYNFTLTDQPTPSTGTGPEADHTNGVKGSGHYIFLEASGKAEGDNACIISATFNDPGPHCLTFTYHMYGKDMGTLNVLEYPSMRRIWSISGDQGNEWHDVQVDLADGIRQVMIECVVGKDFQSDIGLDDLFIFRGSCIQTPEPKRPPRLPPSCSAEDPYCQTPRENKFFGLLDIDDWNIRLAEGSSNNIGRLEIMDENGVWGTVCGDTFTDREAMVACRMLGYFGPPKILETSDPERLRLLSTSNPIKLAGLRCNNAWVPSFSYCCYNKIGVHDCSHADDVVLQCGSDSSLSLWQTYFEECKRTGGFSNGCNSNDDVVWMSTSMQTCGGKRAGTCIPYPTPGGAGLDGSDLTEENFNIDGREVVFHCNFDLGGLNKADNCPLVQDVVPVDDFDWSVTKGSTPTIRTGPSNDHTTGLGYYLYIEVDPDGQQLREGWCAVLLSPFYPAGSPYCLEFWYLMSGDNINKIIVFRENSTDLRLSQTVRKVTGPQGDIWRRIQVDYPASDIPHSMVRVVIAGIVGNGPLGDIAIDDVTLYEGKCSNEPTVELDPLRQTGRR
jgi:hypothetical protein